MAADHTEEFLQGLLLDAIRKIDAVSDKVDNRIDSLNEKLSAQHKDLSDNLTKRLDPLERRLEENTLKIARHEHHFALLGFLITSGGLAFVPGLFNLIGQLFGHK